MLFSVNMTEEAQPYYVLESVHENSKASSPLVQRRFRSRWVMTDYDGHFTISFHFSELILKPFELISWVFSVANQVVVSVVTSLSVYGDDVNVVIFCAISSLEFGSVESHFLEITECIFVKPLLPVVGQEW